MGKRGQEKEVPRCSLCGSVKLVYSTIIQNGKKRRYVHCDLCGHRQEERQDGN